MKDDENTAPEQIKIDSQRIKSDSFHYSRLVAVGILSTFMAAKDKTENANTDIIKDVLDTSDLIGLSRSKIEKDINLYNSNIEKLSQSVELMKELNKRDKNKCIATKQSSKEQD